MGRFYNYKCPECSFSKEFYVGGGFLSEEYFNETEQLEEELRSEIMAGKYGDLIYRLLEGDDEKKLCIHRSTDVFQCDKCYALMLARNKNITLFTDDYKLNLEFLQDCPECKKHGSLKKHPKVIRCPECKKAELDLESFGFWD